MDDYSERAEEIATAFETDGPVRSIALIGDGHIHVSFRCITAAGEYVLQRVNHAVFRDPPALSRNIERVTQYVAARRRHPSGVQTSVSVPELVRLREDAEGGDRYLLHHREEWWRMWIAVPNTVPGPVPAEPDDAYSCGIGFGSFLSLTHGLDAAEMEITIPDFHNITVRLAQLERAVAEDEAGRVATVRDELRAVGERADAMRRFHKAILGDTARVTHNDTKFNNILLDRDSRAPRAVIDLDTVMAGHPVYDFGDGARTGTATAAEDTPDPAAMSLNVAAFQGYADGFLSAVLLERSARERLQPAPAYMTYIMAVRFLTDYLNGDRYYHVDDDTHNLRRARAQLSLLRDLERRANRIRRALGPAV